MVEGLGFRVLYLVFMVKRALIGNFDPRNFEQGNRTNREGLGFQVLGSACTTPS